MSKYEVIYIGRYVLLTITIIFLLVEMFLIANSHK